MTENNHDFDLYVHLYPIMKNEQNDNYKMTIFCLRVIRENDFSKFEIKNFDCIYEKHLLTGTPVHRRGAVYNKSAIFGWIRCVLSFWIEERNRPSCDEWTYHIRTKSPSIFINNDISKNEKSSFCHNKRKHSYLSFCV